MLKKLTALLICAVMLSLSVTVNAAENYTKEDISKTIDGIISYKSAILKADDTASFVQKLSETTDNSETQWYIISLSKYYRFNIVVMLFLAILTISLNLIFLKNTDLGIIGVAMATAISLTLFNIVKIIFNYLKFKVHPFSIEMLYALILSFSAINIAILLPNFNISIINLFYKPAVVFLILFIGNHFLKIYPLDKYLNITFIKSLFKF